MSFHVPEQHRYLRGPMGSDAGYGNNGAFIIPHANPHSSLKFTVIASDGEGWEHVSVSLQMRCPTWPELCYVKGLFWDDWDCVVQYHPPRSEYVNNHAFCLHMWRPTGVALPMPPSILVGYQSLQPKDLASMSRAERLALLDAANMSAA